MQEKYGCLKARGILPIAARQLNGFIVSIASDQDFGGVYRSALVYFRARSCSTAALGPSAAGRSIKDFLEALLGAVQNRRLWVVWDFSEGIDEFPAELLLDELDQLRNPGAEDIEIIEPDAGIIMGVSHFGEVWMFRGQRGFNSDFQNVN